jgi:hypothetical protein
VFGQFRRSLIYHSVTQLSSVGNVPYNMGEDQLIDVFKSVGQVIGFR